MAAPNVFNPTTCTLSQYSVTIASSGTNSSVSNAAASGQVFRVVSIYITNLSTSTVAQVSVAIVTGATVVNLAYKVNVPTNSAITIVTRDAPVYVPENYLIKITNEGSVSIDYHCSYEVIS